jgi:hypothetical protein
MKQYIYNLIKVCSMLINTLTGGDPEDTLSQRTAKAMKRNPNGWYKHLAKIINFVFWLLLGENDHVADSLKGESQSAEVWKW